MPGGAAAEAAIRALVAAGILGVGAYNSIYTVEAGHKAVVFNRLSGVKDQVYPEGLNFNVPWLEYPTIFR